MKENEQFLLIRVAIASLLPIKSAYPDVLRRDIAMFVIRDIPWNKKKENYLDMSLPVDTIRNLSKEIARSLSKTFEQHLSKKNALSIDLALTLYNDASQLSSLLDIDFRILKIYEQKVKVDEHVHREIEKYFSGNLLILNCLTSGCYVSNPIRERLLHEMFLPKEDLMLSDST